MSHELLSSPGARLRFMREALGLKQEELARKVHSSQPAISQWENDHWLPHRSMQYLLAETLNTSRAFLFGQDEKVEAS